MMNTKLNRYEKAIILAVFYADIAVFCAPICTNNFHKNHFFIWT